MNAESVGNEQELEGQQGPAPADDPDPAALLAAAATERDQLAAEKADLQDRYLRAQAEFQNFRRRVEKEKLDLAEYASSETVRGLLPILDDFERALRTECADKDYAKGMDLIYQRLLDALTRLGLEPLLADGQPFDPNLHHAVEMVETDGAPDHTVLAEFQPGYKFKGKLLRPAMVKVAVEPQAKSE